MLLEVCLHLNCMCGFCSSKVFFKLELHYSNYCGISVLFLASLLCYTFKVQISWDGRWNPILMWTELRGLLAGFSSFQWYDGFTENWTWTHNLVLQSFRKYVFGRNENGKDLRFGPEERGWGSGKIEKGNRKLVSEFRIL